MMYKTATLIILLFMVFKINAQQVQLVNKPDDRKVDVLINEELFSSYFYPETIKKPVLWPLISQGGHELTRCYPMKKKAGERVDHPHHVGIWLNYGNVNGLDFWNNSDAIPDNRKKEFGSIRLKNIEKVEVDQGVGLLVATSDWIDSNKNILLHEKTKLVFSAKDNVRIIDWTTKLTAVEDVLFKDDKEGMFGLRVARELELPESKPIKLTDSHGNVTEVEASDNFNVTGNYLSSEGISGGIVWGTRARWMKLHGNINGEDVAIVIVDNPGNVGYPTYWHARGYGLFAANPLGQEIFSDGKESLNFSLKKGESATFNYRVLVFSGNPTPDEIENLIK